MTELRDLALLEPRFRGDVEVLIEHLASKGHDLRPTTTVRSPWSQARPRPDRPGVVVHLPRREKPEPPIWRERLRVWWSEVVS